MLSLSASQLLSGVGATEISDLKKFRAAQEETASLEAQLKKLSRNDPKDE